MTTASPPDSPCIGVCRLRPEGFCAGCGRSIEEIAIWARADDQTRRAIRTAAARRLAGRNRR